MLHSHRFAEPTHHVDLEPVVDEHVPLVGVGVEQAAEEDLGRRCGTER